MAKRRRVKLSVITAAVPYDGLVGSIADLLRQSRHAAARSVNSILTATYWEIGRRIVEFEQGGKERAAYGENLLAQLGRDLTARFGRGFSSQGLYKMRAFAQGWKILPTLSGELQVRARLPEETLDSPAPTSRVTAVKFHQASQPSAAMALHQTSAFPLSWSHYVRLMAVEKPHARVFYEAEAIRGGWSVRQLDRQISTQFFERTSRSKQQGAMSSRGRKSKRDDAVSVVDEVRDPYLLEFLDLKDEYSESDLEEALIRHLESFLLELGAGFTFVARQKRIRVGSAWYRMDLLLYHRALRCLVVIDLKLGAFTHADAGQMSLYLTYIKEHLALDGEADPVGIILCSEKDDAVVHYAMGSMNARVFASKYLTQLPDEETLRREIATTKQALLGRAEQSSVATSQGTTAKRSRSRKRPQD